MIKKLLIVLVILFVAGIAGLYFFGTPLLNRSVEIAVPKVGSLLTQTKVTLDDADLSVLSGSGTLTGLNIGNPPGYNSSDIFALGEVDLDIEPASILKDTIVINRVYIKAPMVSYERGLRRSNLDDLLRNIESFTGAGAKESQAQEAGEEPAPKEDKAPGKHLLIREFVIEDGSVYVAALGTGTTLPLPRIELRDIGTENKGASIAQVVSLVMKEVIKAIGPVLADSGAAVFDSGQGLIESGIGILGDTVDGAGEGTSEGLEKATKGIKNIFGK